jgi:hypothetical protein
MEELSLCNNMAPGEDGIEFGHQKCFKRINFLRSANFLWRGYHGGISRCDADFIQGSDTFSLEYRCIAFDRMADTHMLKLERLEYRCLRIALGIMQSTHVQTLEIIGGVPPLRMLNHEYLISAFSTAGPLRQELVALSSLNSPKIVREFNMVKGYNLEPDRSVFEYPLRALLHVFEINDEVERELSSISKDCYQAIVPRLVPSVSSRFESSAVFFTNR